MKAELEKLLNNATGNRQMIEALGIIIDLLDSKDKHIEELEARDVATPEYLQSWIDRANTAEAQLDEVREALNIHDWQECVNTIKQALEGE